MARTLLDLSKSLARRANSLSTVGNDKAVKAAFAIVNDLAFVSPVDTSLFLSNWQVSLNTPVPDIRTAYHYGSAGSTQMASANATIEAAQAVLATKKPGDVIYISNALPYAAALNAGSSAQAPAGFIERAVLIGRLIVGEKNVK